MRAVLQPLKLGYETLRGAVCAVWVYEAVYEGMWWWWTSLYPHTLIYSYAVCAVHHLLILPPPHTLIHSYAYAHTLILIRSYTHTLIHSYTHTLYALSTTSSYPHTLIYSYAVCAVWVYEEVDLRPQCMRSYSSWTSGERAQGGHADVCWRMLTYADVCWRMLTYADVRSKRELTRRELMRWRMLCMLEAL
jgi:hypothetical protein